jgi:hypothetical protein
MGFTVAELQRQVATRSARGIDRRAARDLVARKSRQIASQIQSLEQARDQLRDFQACACDDLARCGVLEPWLDGRRALPPSPARRAKRQA